MARDVRCRRTRVGVGLINPQGRGVKRLLKGELLEGVHSLLGGECRARFVDLSVDSRILLKSPETEGC
jgi:hypothetical protein